MKHMVRRLALVAIATIASAGCAQLAYLADHFGEMRPQEVRQAQP
jgi:hypothetical protein